ncbi:MAG: SUMF1/EgtB/PvdO family nonheme iron enzyme [Anaerolineae bacterium]|nr:SUMF1/EgtB/PvdO family nonheme iron enzyme [Anaerolineae bacterium]
MSLQEFVATVVAGIISSVLAAFLALWFQKQGGKSIVTHVIAAGVGLIGSLILVAGFGQTNSSGEIAIRTAIPVTQTAIAEEWALVHATETAFANQAHATEILLATVQSTANFRDLPTIISTPVENNSQWISVTKEFDGVLMVLVPRGCFFMGENKEDEQQCFDTPYWIDKYEVTNALYKLCVEAKDCHKPVPPDLYVDPNRADRPVTNIGWFDAKDYTNWRKCRFPTEAEWEYALRGVDNITSFENTSGSDTSFVGSNLSDISWIGAYDMIGNVSEWTSTIYDPKKFGHPYDAKDGREDLTDKISERITRAYSFGDFKGTVDPTHRTHSDPRYGSQFTGFRCVRDFQLSDLDGLN